MKILVVVPHPISTMGYMLSQLVNQFAFLAAIGREVTILSAGDLECQDVISFDSELRIKGIKGLFVKPSRHSVLTYAKGVLRTASVIRELKPDAIYARDVWGALVATFGRRLSGIRGIKIIFDVRGAVPEESALSGASAYKNRLIEILERMAVSKATALNAVTIELSEHIFRKYGRRADTIIPCCMESVPPCDTAAREAMRAGYGFSENETVYVYSGGLSRWQLFEECLDLFSRIADVDTDARLLVLTPDKERAAELLSHRISSELYRLASVRQEEVAICLQAGDAGFLLRDDNVVNRVAFPIKFAEYLSAGLPVIATEGVAEIAAIIRSENLGLVISPRGEVAYRVAEWALGVRDSREQWRTRCRAYVENHLVWDVYRDSYKVLYAETKAHIDQGGEDRC